MISPSLVRQAQQGDQRALAALLAALRPVVLRYCVGRVDCNDAEDVTQDALMRFANALKAYRPLASVEAYAVGIASNCIAAVHRERYRAKAVLVADVPDTATAPAAEQAALRSETNRTLARVMLTLTSQQREIVLMRNAGFSVNEVAEHVGITPGALRVSHHRALRRLRDLDALQELT
jgi:RNA polymerase sigma-70 factor (ECF subfamily)